MLAVAVAAFPKGFIPVIDPGGLGAVTICALTLAICIPLNRAGRINAACIVFCIGAALAVAWGPPATPGGIGMEDLPTFDLFALPIVIAGILLPRRWPFFIWFGCAIFIILDVTYEAHHQNLADYINEVGLYATIILPMILTFVIACVSWLSAGSVERAIFEADRTADLERAYDMMAEQNERLESAVALIESVHARVAAGDLNARAPVGTGELVGLSASLNLMLDRLARLRTAESSLSAVENGSRVLAQYTWELSAGHFQYAPPQTGLATLDFIGAALDQMRRAIAVEFANLTTGLSAIAHAGETLLNITRAMASQSQESARRVGALNDFVQSMRSVAERAESSLIAPADWLEQATNNGWSDGAALSQTVNEGLSNVRQVIAMADQSPSGQLALESVRADIRELYQRAGAADRDFTDILTASRALLSRINNPSGSLGGPTSLP
jgi:methyl-accepting chemotaxis protein